MIRRFTSPLAATALAAAVVLALSPAANAQLFRGRNTMPATGTPYGNYPGNYYPGTVYPGYQGYQGGFPAGTTGMPTYTYPNTGMYNTYPQYSTMPQGAYTQPYGMAGTMGRMQPMIQSLGNTAQLTVRLPANAQLWVEDFQPKQTGPVRVLTTPQLQPGQPYHYTLKAQWDENGHPVTQQRTVDFQAGGNVTVDFTQPAPQNPPTGTQPTSTQPPQQG